MKARGVAGELTLAGHRVDALSIGGIETCIHLPGFKVAFDIGRCPKRVVQRRRILFTHSHMDHMGGVAWHCATRALRHMPPPIYGVPRENVEGFERLIDAWRALDRSDMRHELVPLGPGDELRLPGNIVARPFRSPHTAPCQGYGLWSQRRKLLPELAGCSNEELRRLRVEQKREITQLEEVPEVAFTGDTRIEVVDREEVVRRARLLILEVTFLDDRVSVEDCRRRGHVHLDEVLERADLFENEAILFTHASARYRKDEIVRILERRLPAALRGRVTPLLNGH